MQREIDISRYFPVLMQEIKQFQGIRDGENPEFRTLFQSMEQVLNRAFIEESDEVGVRRWERILHLASNGDLDVRKFRILVRMNEKLPYTMPILKQQLELLCGSDGYTVVLNQDAYTLQVRLVFLVSGKLAAVREYLERIKPANILVQYGLWNPAIVLQEHQKLVFYNFGIKVSFWNGFGSDSIRFNGSRKFDGSLLFNQSVQGIKLYRFNIKLPMQNQVQFAFPKLNARYKIRNSNHYAIPQTGVFARSITKNGWESINAAFQTGEANMENLFGQWIRNNPFFFDSAFHFDGVQTFSGGITKEVL